MNASWAPQITTCEAARYIFANFRPEINFNTFFICLSISICTLFKINISNVLLQRDFVLLYKKITKLHYRKLTRNCRF